MRSVIGIAVAVALMIVQAGMGLAQQRDYPYEPGYPENRRLDQEVRPVDPPRSENPDVPADRGNDRIRPPAEPADSGSSGGWGRWAAIGGAVAGGIILGKVLTRKRGNEDEQTKEPEPPNERANPVPPREQIRLVTVPDLTGRSVEEASTVLEAAGLTMGKQTQVESEGLSETIRAQAPRGGTQVLPGSPVHVVVAVQAKVTVPDLTGRPVEDAPAILNQAGLTIGRQSQVESEQSEGTVAAQAPRGGTQVFPRTPVHLVVAVPLPVRKPGQEGRPETGRPDEPAVPDPVEPAIPDETAEAEPQAQPDDGSSQAATDGSLLGQQNPQSASNDTRFGESSANPPDETVPDESMADSEGSGSSAGAANSGAPAQPQKPAPPSVEEKELIEVPLEAFPWFVILIVVVLTVRAVVRSRRPSADKAKESEKRRPPLHIRVQRDRGKQHIEKEKVAQTQFAISIRAFVDAGNPSLRRVNSAASQQTTRRVA